MIKNNLHICSEKYNHSDEEPIKKTYSLIVLKDKHFSENFLQNK